MGVLFMMPRWEDAFGGWMQRTMLGISQDLAGIVVNDSQGNSSWMEKIPVVSLRPPRKELRYFSRLAGLAGLTLETAPPGEENVLRRAIRRLPVTHALCQYGTFAARFMKVWRETELPLYVNFFGYDAFFDLRDAERPEKKRHPAEYMASIRELERRATFIACSQFMKSLLVDAGVSPDRVVVNYLGVPVSEKKHVHERTSGVQILHLGRLVDFKSPDRTIRAFEIAKSKGLDGRLVMVGDGPLLTTCELLRLRSPYRDSVRLVAPTFGEGAQRIYAESDIFTQHNVTGEITRQCEGLGVSPIEAMAHGLPVVGTRSGGVPETVVDGETGILVEPGDVEAQATAFLRLAAEPSLRQRMGDAGRARVSAVFSPQQETEQLRNIMRLPSRS